MNSPLTPTEEAAKERAIIATVIAGDIDQFDILVANYKDRLFHFILKLGATENTEDLAQEAFIEAFKSLKSFKNRSKFSTWLFGIALNLCRNHFNRSPENRYKVLPIDQIDGIPDRDDSPADYLEKKIYFEKLQKEFNLLSEPLREVLLLCSIEGLSYNETADLLKIPEGTVKSRLYNARKTLHEAMQEKEK